jgi:hypothetical protein
MHSVMILKKSEREREGVCVCVYVRFPSNVKAQFPHTFLVSLNELNTLDIVLP